MKNISIYVHIPFCDSKCYYCGFCSSVQKEDVKNNYFLALLNEIKNSKKDSLVKTIYFGGGTPSSVKPEYISNTLEEIKNAFTVDENAEITIECNPNSTTKEKLLAYKKMGFNRISFGIQSFNKRSLKFVGRVSDKQLNNYKKNTFNVLKMANEIGFNNISADFMLGLPYQTNFQVKSFLKDVSKYVTHFSCYMLQLEEGTKLFQILNGKDVDQDKLADQYEIAVKTLKKLGFARYEISNFAKKGYESKHNKGYWKRTEYLGFGISAHSFYDDIRIANTSDLEKYISFWDIRKSRASLDILEKKHIVTTEKLSKKEMAEEVLMLSLRTTEGLNLQKFKETYFDLEKHHAKKIAMMLKNGLITLEGNILRLTGKGFLVANEIIVNFADDFAGLFMEI